MRLNAAFVFILQLNVTDSNGKNSSHKAMKKNCSLGILFWGFNKLNVPEVKVLKQSWVDMYSNLVKSILVQ